MNEIERLAQEAEAAADEIIQAKLNPPLYHQEDITTSTGKIYIVEAEKDADSLQAAQLIATATRGKNLHSSQYEHFEGRPVVIIPAEGKAGHKRAIALADRLYLCAESVTILEPLGNISDWFKAGGHTNKLFELVKAAPEWEPAFKASASYQNGTVTDAGSMAEPTLTAEGFKVPPAKLSTAAEILATEFPEPVWIVPDLLPAGLTFLAGKPKLGKSWLALQMALAVAAGGKFFDRDVEQGRVLYLALEDNKRRLKDRMQQQGWDAKSAENCTFMVMKEFRDLIGDPLNGGIEKLAEMIQEGGYRLVIIDTITRFYSLAAKVRDQNKGQEMTNALTPLQELAIDRNFALKLIDHHNKAAGANPDAINDIGGAIQKGGIADTAWGIYRERGKTETKLQVTGRDVEEVTLAIQFDMISAAWQCDGDYYALKITEQRQQILDYLHDVQAATATDVSKELGIYKQNAGRQLKDMLVAGLLTKEVEGRNIFYRLK